MSPKKELLRSLWVYRFVGYYRRSLEVANPIASIVKANV